jgi:hypothetical protein
MSSYGQQWLNILRTADLEYEDFTPLDEAASGDPTLPDDDHSAHAPGQVCAKCGRRIKADQPARKRGVSDWVHDLCPE